MMRACLAVQFESRMRRAVVVLAAVLAVPAGRKAFAQEPPPPLPHVVIDLQGLVPVFPNDAAQLAASRPVLNRDLQPALTVAELPGAGFGGRAGAHVYFLKYRGITIGAGGDVMLGRSSSAPADSST